jgi:hypothetical protein
MPDASDSDGDGPADDDGGHPEPTNFPIAIPPPIAEIAAWELQGVSPQIR